MQNILTKPNFRLLIKVLIYTSILLASLVISTKSFEFGKIFGILATWTFILTVIPGIVNRLGVTFSWIKNPSSYLHSSRQQLGILMWLLAFEHYLSSALIPIILPIVQSGGKPELNAFFAFGLSAMFLSFPLFLTSNNWIKAKMKKWWKRLHSLTYIVLWLIFGHVAIAGNPIFMVVYLIVGILQIYSLVKIRMVKTV